jgi:hypothetical protein
VARGRLENQLSDPVFPPKANAADERLAQRLCARHGDLVTFLRRPGLRATDRRPELAARFTVVLRNAWAQTFLMSTWRPCWQQGRSALDFLS